EWRVSTVSVLAWAHRGPAGSCRYLPEGRLARPSQWRPGEANTAMVIDVDALCPTVDPWARPRPSTGLSAASTIRFDQASHRWIVFDHGAPVAQYEPHEVQVALWWNALVFRDEQDRALYDGHDDDLSPRLMAELLAFDLRDRGHDVSPTRTPARDVAMVR